MRPTLLAFVFALSCRLAAAQESPGLQAAPATQPATSVRSAPADLLTDLRDDGSLITGLEDASPEVRWVAARGLARLAEADAIPAIAARIARESDEDVLAELIFALGQRGQLDAAAAAPPLLSLLGYDAPAIRAAAVAALARLADDAHTSRIILLLSSDPSPTVRGAAALALFRLDGDRYDQPRTALPEVLDARDAALSQAATADEDPGVRWRATYAMAGVRARGSMARLIRLPLDDSEPLTRLFALRGLRSLERLHLADGAGGDASRRLEDLDVRVVIEAVRAQCRSGSPERLAALIASHPDSLVRFTAVESLRERLDQPDVDDAGRARWCEAVQSAARSDGSPMVRREAAALIVARAPPEHALFDLYLLAGSSDPRDRERAAKELAERHPALEAPGLLERLLSDEPAVAAAALVAPASPEVFVARLVAALGASDPALVAAAAETARQGQRNGDVTMRLVDPGLTAALQAAHERAVGPEMKEARAALRKALDLPPDTAPPAGDAADGADGAALPLLERLLAEHREALADPSPKVHLLTSKGPILLELDRVNAPRHVASFLELAAAGFYDGLDFHRVVPNFVVQGLDPRGDGYGTGGRRLPDEFSPRPYDAGTLGMPNAGEPHTGGCQIFITHIPTPHLDGNYTVFGKVIEGMDVVQRLEIGDTVTSVRLVPPDTGKAKR